MRALKRLVLSLIEGKEEVVVVVVVALAPLLRVSLMEK